MANGEPEGPLNPVAPSSPIGRRMFRNLPTVYVRSLVMAALMQGGGVGLDGVAVLNRELVDQFYVTLAGDAGLALWEEFLGLPIRPEGLTIQQRRDRCLAALRARGTPTLPRLRQIANGFSDSDVRLIEDFPGWRLIVLFGEAGVPERETDVIAALRESAQAELVLDIFHRFATWEGMSESGMTWEEIHQLGLSWEALKTYPPFVTGQLWPTAGASAAAPEAEPAPTASRRARPRRR